MSAATLFVVGATHRNVPLAVREKLALSAEVVSALPGDFSAIAGLREFAVLSTCNRVEFYGVADHPEAISRLSAAFCARQGFDPAEFTRLRLDLRGPEAVQHLLEVASGLDSQMLGETEIFGQVKDAYAGAQAAGTTGPVLNRVFQKSFQAAKHVRTHTAINEGQVSVANVAVDLAQSIFGEIAAARILLLGAGEIGEKTARAFQSRAAKSLTVSSRSPARAMELATELGASAMPFDQREARLGEFDVAVCATAAPDLVLPLAAVVAAMQARPARPLFLIDLALPRDIDPAAAGLANVFLYNLDDLARIAEENRAARAAEIGKCRALVAEKSAALWQQVRPNLEALAAGEDAAPSIRHEPA
jgi:glutamyl-tRNA reductase